MNQNEFLYELLSDFNYKEEKKKWKGKRPFPLKTRLILLNLKDKMYYLGTVTRLFENNIMGITFDIGFKASISDFSPLIVAFGMKHIIKRPLSKKDLQNVATTFISKNLKFDTSMYECYLP